MSAKTGEIIGWSAVYGTEPAPRAHAVRLDRRGEHLVAAPACGAKVVLCGALESEPPSYATGGPCGNCARIAKLPRPAATAPAPAAPTGVARVRAADVRVGDELSTGERAPYDWARVHDVEVSPNGRTVAIHTRGWTTYKHPDEGVAVRRLAVEPADGSHMRACSASAGGACDCADSEEHR